MHLDLQMPMDSEMRLVKAMDCLSGMLKQKGFVKQKGSGIVMLRRKPSLMVSEMQMAM